jgi:hypothetical protein
VPLHAKFIACKRNNHTGVPPRPSILLVDLKFHAGRSKARDPATTQQASSTTTSGKSSKRSELKNLEKEKKKTLHWCDDFDTN